MIIPGRCFHDKPVVVDSCRLQITYSVAVRTTSDVRLCDRAILQIGQKRSLFYGLTTWRLDRNWTLQEKGVRYDDLDDEIVSYTILKNLPSGEMTVTHHLPYANHCVMQYEESSHGIRWELLSDTLTICGYTCFGAKCHFGGRNWTVWYTPNVPISNGPWKFADLPGLILKAADETGSFEFVCIGIEESYAPIAVYETATKHVSKKQWQVYERNLYASPVKMLGANDDVCFFMKKSSSKSPILLDETWSIPYNPIELE